MRTNFNKTRYDGGSLNFIGLDVGFSTTRMSSGVACLKRGTLSVGCATASWESRAELLGDFASAHMVAIDAPVLTIENYESRDCERIFTLGRFQRRCKPGLSHIRGTGRQLRDAGYESVNQLSHLAAECAVAKRFPRVRSGQNIVEAFPNAFLGVLLSARDFDDMPRLRRGEKFDWLFERCRVANRISTVVEVIGLPQIKEVLSSIETNTDHDQRAALVCLLIAAGVAVGRYTAVGNRYGGYFFLPTWNAWALWAQEEIELQRHRMNSLEVWIDGSRFMPDDSLPTAHNTAPQTDERRASVPALFQRDSRAARGGAPSR
jgi:predicted RNase H-like nuclease